VHLMRDSHKAHEALEMAQGLIGISSSSKSKPANMERRDVPEFTPRQLEVLELLVRGRSVKEIGQELYLSQATVRNHVRFLLQALGAHSQLEVVAKARIMGLLSS
jgi:DNA-binding NarL/FixJ family response regulator